jgi:hypothetical protein
LPRRRAGQHRIFSQLNDSNGSDAVVEDAVRNTVRCNASQPCNAPLQQPLQRTAATRFGGPHALRQLA